MEFGTDFSTSLRANGSRERAPDDRLREAIHSFFVRRHGLLRFARNDGRYSCAFSRRIAPEVCKLFSRPLEIRGRRECRMRAAPEVSCAMCTESARMSIQGSGEHPTLPAQWLYGL